MTVTPAEAAGGVVAYEKRGVGTFVRVGGKPGQMTDVPPPPFNVKIRGRDKPSEGVVLPLHDKPPTPSAGGGGWEEKALPRRRSVLIWKGGGLMKLALSVLFDGNLNVAINTSAYKTLLGFWRPSDPTEEPPVLKLISPGDIIPYIVEIPEWVLEDVAWGDGVADPEGRRVQQILELTFSEYRPDERLKPASASRAPKRKPKAVATIKRSGESLGVIAGHYHVKGGWKALGRAQTPPITDPRATKKGRRIYIPA